MKKILGLALGLSFVFGTLVMAQDTTKDTSTPTKTKKSKKSKKSKGGDKMSGDTSSAPKQ